MQSKRVAWKLKFFAKMIFQLGFSVCIEDFHELMIRYININTLSPTIIKNNVIEIWAEILHKIRKI